MAGVQFLKSKESFSRNKLKEDFPDLIQSSSFIWRLSLLQTIQCQIIKKDCLDLGDCSLFLMVLAEVSTDSLAFL